MILKITVQFLDIPLGKYYILHEKGHISISKIKL